jgi:copper chaperone NosL
VKSVPAKVVVVTALAALAVLGWPRTPAGPEPIAWGRDVCAACHRIVSRPGFAAELRHADGSLSKYDDIGCLMGAIAAGRGTAATAWVQDRATQAFIPLRRAHLVRADPVVTRARSGLVAFAKAWRARRFADAHDARVLTFDDVLRDTMVAAADPGARE